MANGESGGLGPDAGGDARRRFLRDAPLAHKLLAITMVTSLGALLLTGTVIAVREVSVSRRAMLRELATLADILGKNSAAALSFRDAETARDVVNSLGARRDIARAAVVLPDGSPLAVYVASGEPPVRAVPRPLEARTNLGARRVVIVHPVRVDREPLGALYLECRTDDLHARVRDITLSIAVMLLLSGTLAHMLSVRLNRVVSEPIKRLSRAAERVSESRDYSVRVDWHSHDELGLLTRSFNHMLAQIQEQEQALRASEEKLRHAQKMEAVGQLAGGVAHDFNNLLTVINGYAGLLEARTPADDPRRAKLQEIRRAGERAADLTRQLLAFGRKQVLQPEVLELPEVLAGVQGMLERIIGVAVRMVWITGARVPRVLADPGQVEQVLMNLVVNARDAMPRGGTITVETSEVELDEAHAAAHADVRPGRYALVAVTDTGTGIPADVQPHIFEPFFTTKGVGKGTGLGLSTVYGIVKQSGGHLAFQSEPGVGTTFRIYLPAVDGVSEQVRPREHRPATGDNVETILLVEDEAMVRELAREILEPLGYRVLACAGPEEAIEASLRFEGRIHLVLTDVTMPGMNGRDLYERLVRSRPEMPVLYMSGYSDGVLGEDGVLAVEAAFLGKPFTPETLAARTRAVLDAARAAA